MKLLISFLFTVVATGIITAQDHTVRGFIYDKSNGEPMAFEKVRILNVTDSSIVAGALTDVNGFYSIPKLTVGKFIMKVDNPAYQEYTQNIEIKIPKGITDIKIELTKAIVKEFQDITVTAEAKQKKNEVQVSQ
ncbi:MAG: carboxypeptidase-like regulatory domain-containing protein, partial [Flavobacteriales bacterium]